MRRFFFTKKKSKISRLDRVDPIKQSSSELQLDASSYCMLVSSGRHHKPFDLEGLFRGESNRFYQRYSPVDELEEDVAHILRRIPAKYRCDKEAYILFFNGSKEQITEMAHLGRFNEVIAYARNITEASDPKAAIRNSYYTDVASLQRSQSVRCS